MRTLGSVPWVTVLQEGLTIIWIPLDLYPETCFDHVPFGTCKEYLIVIRTTLHTDNWLCPFGVFLKGCNMDSSVCGLLPLQFLH